ncbi:phage major capsid protein [Gluconobacter sp. OJB]|uniref:phage major capsid protein n=1 Tax=Gluconobacter sp. OJB TaxID=3145196 RepID=UPI0031F95997
MNSFNINKGISSLNLPKGSEGITKEIIKTLSSNYGADHASHMIRNEAGSKSAADMIVKNALTTAQPTVSPDVRNETIALLTADCAVRKVAKTVSMPYNNLTYPRMRLGSSASWVGEGSNYVPSAQDFDTINFTGKKLTGFTYTTLEFNNFSLSDAVAHVVSDLQNQVALAEDRTFIMGSTAGALAPSYSLIGNAGTNLTSTGTDSVAIAADLANIKSSLQTKFVNISRGVVFGSPAIFNSLENLQTSYGVYPFREEIRMGKLNGFTIASTAQIPTDVDTSAAKDGSAKNGSPLIFVAPQHLIIADAMTYDIRSTDVGSWNDNGTVMNAFSQDLIAYKLANWVDFGVEHDAAVAVLNTVGWTTMNVDGAYQYVAPAQTGGNSASASKGKGA